MRLRPPDNQYCVTFALNGMLFASMMASCVKPLMVVVLCIFTTLSWAEVAIPPLKSHVTDLTQTLSKREITQLEQILTDFEARKGSQLAVLIVPTTLPETIEQYSIRVVESWKLGRKGVDDGVLLLIAKQDRAVRIEVGYGLEGILPDAIAKRIIEEIIIPQFRQGNYFDGIKSGIEQILRVIEGESLPPPSSKQDSSASGGLGMVLDNFIPILLVFLVLGKMLQTLLGRIVGATVTGTIAGSIIWLIFSSLVVALVIAIIIFIISLFENTGRGFYRGGHSRWPGGGFGSGGSFGGGFSGGGGGFGGGGASGRW